MSHSLKSQRAWLGFAFGFVCSLACLAILGRNLARRDLVDTLGETRAAQWAANEMLAAIKVAVGPDEWQRIVERATHAPAAEVRAELARWPSPTEAR